MKKISIGLLGLGTVGSGVWKLLKERKGSLAERIGCEIEIKKVLVRDPAKKRVFKVPPEILTTTAEEILRDPEISVVVELMGGIQPAQSYCITALERGRHVVTANKELLAEMGPLLFQAAREKGRFIGYEASVAGGIPILQAIRDGFVGNRIETIFAIINGTSNYILSEMARGEKGFGEALREAQEKGYAERDPSKDIEGRDAAEKLSLLISLCSQCPPPLRQITVEGIRDLSETDIHFAQKLGYVIKPLAIAKWRGNGIEARVHPTLVPSGHPLADVGGVFNAIFLKGDAVGEAMFFGCGAGMMPTASAVVADIALAARCVLSGTTPPGPLFGEKVTILPPSELITEYYLRFSVVDRPGVLGQIANCLGKNEVSISSVHQYEQGKGSKVPIVVMTHEALEGNVQKAIGEIDRLEVVVGKTILIRAERLSL